MSATWLINQMFIVIRFFYIKSYKILYTHFTIFISKYNYTPNLNTNNYSMNLIWKKNEETTHTTNNGLNIFSSLGLTSTVVFKENTALIDNTKTFFIQSYKNMQFFFSIVLLGFYNQNIVTSFFTKYSTNTYKNLITQYCYY